MASGSARQRPTRSGFDSVWDVDSGERSQHPRAAGGAIKWDILLVGSTVALAASDADERLLQQVPASWHQRSLNISDGALYGSSAIVGGIYLAGLITKNEHEQEVGVRTAESVVDSVILYGAMKAVFARQRPFTGPGEGKFFAGTRISVNDSSRVS